MAHDQEEFDTSDFLHWVGSRRKLLKSGFMAGAAVAGAGLLAACKGGGAGSSAGGGGGAASGGGGGAASSGGNSSTSGSGSSISPTPRHQTVIIDQGVFTVYDDFNPLIPNGETYQGGVGQLAKEYPFYLNMATGKLMYWQGTGWSYNKDFTECTLKLDPKVTWSDGKPCTSADVVFTTELEKKHFSVLGGSTAAASWTQEVVSMDAPDAQTTVFHLNQHDPRFHYNFVCQIISANLLILPKHVWEGKNITTFKNNPPIYTGPYKLKEASSNLGIFLWEKTDNYWNKAKMDPAPQYVCYRNTPTDADLDNEQFKNAETDSPGSISAFQYATALQKGGNKDVLITNFVDSDQRCIIPNCDPSRGALADPKFRYALSMLIDREKVIKDVWPVPTVADIWPWPTYPNTDSWDNKQIAAKFAQYRTYNPTKAGQLLDELGITKSGGKRHYNGKPVSLQVITPPSSAGTLAQEYIVGQLLVTELEALGISASIKQPSSAVYSELVAKGQYDIRSEWFGGAILDQYQLYEQFNSKYYAPIGKSALSWDQMRLKEPAFDATINKLATMDPTAKSSVPTYNEALTQFYTYQPIIPYLQTVYSHIFNTTYWTNWPTDKDLYQIPSNWWGQFLFVIGSVKPTGKS